MIGRMTRGAMAGLVGTLAMDLLWWSRYRRDGGQDGFADWEFAADTASFDEASAPGQVGQRAARLLGIELPDAAADTTTNVVHWLTGVGYGTTHGILSDGTDHGLARGLLTGAGAFANSYATLGALGVYEPIWEYDASTLAKDFSAHLLFGAASGLTYTTLSRWAHG